MTEDQQSGRKFLSPALGAALRRLWWVPVGLCVFGFGLGMLISTQQKAEYSASSLVVVKGFQNLLAQLDNGGGGTLEDQNRVVATQSQLVDQPEVARRVIDRLDLPADDEELIRKRTSVGTEVNSDILTVTTTWTDEQTSIALANAFADEFVKFRAGLDNGALVKAERDLTRRIRDLSRSGGSESYLQQLLRTQLDLRTRIALGSRNTQVVHRADEATQVAPRPLRTSALLGLAGLFVGIFAVGLLQVVDRRTRSPEEVAEILGAPLLAGISAGMRGRAASDSELVMLTDSEGRQSEEYRILAATVELSNVGGGSRVLLVASALGGEGKSSVAANLSVAAARAGRSVALVELDLRRPRLTTRFGLGRSPGITNVLTAAADLDDALIEIDVGHPYDGGDEAGTVAPLSSERGRLFVIPAGPIPPNPADFAAADGIGDLLRTLRAQFDLVVVDAPPWLVVGDALAIARHVDGIVVTVRDRSTPRTALQELRRRLDVTGAAVVGFVLTNVRPGQVGGYGDYTSRSPRGQSRKAARRVASGAGLSSLLRKPEPPER